MPGSCSMTFQVPYRPNGRSVWLGKDLVRTEDWIYTLPPHALDEIDASVRQLNGRDAYGKAVERHEFRLTSIADDIARRREEIASGRGFFVIRGLPKDRYCDNELGLIFRG